MFILNSSNGKVLKTWQIKKKNFTKPIQTMPAKHNDFRNLQKQYDDSQNQPTPKSTK